MQQLLVKYDSEIGLKSKHTLKYFQYDMSNQVANCESPPPSILLNRHHETTNRVNRFVIVEQKESRDLKIKTKQLKDHLTFGCKIHLVNLAGQYLTYSSKSELKFDKASLDQGLNAMLYKTATWTVVDLANNMSKKPVTIYDDLCLKNVYGNYLVCLEGGEVNASGLTLSPQTTWNLMKADVPYIPSWLYERSPFNKFMNLESQPMSSEKKNLNNEKPNIQELLLLEDLFDIMLGGDGVYIKKKPGTFQFQIEPHLEVPSCSIALVQLTSKILDMASYFYQIQHYISINSIQQGTVCQALCGGLRQLLREYKLMVIQLDEEAKKGLTLQKMWYFIQHSLKIMRSLYQLVRQGEKLKGGQLISCILKVLNSTTDSQVTDIYYFLLGKTIRIYVQMVSKWIYEGVVEDKNEQFMIVVQEDRNEKEWICWDDKYLLRRQQVPIIFSKDAHQILTTGKYLNIIKKCKKRRSAGNPMVQDIEANINKYIKNQDFGDFIYKAYNWANQELKIIIFQEYKLLDVLRSIKGYFFLQYGDFFVHFMELAQPYLSEFKNSKVQSDPKHKINQFSPSKLQSLFQLVMRTSSANSDPYNQDFSCKIDSTSLYQQSHRIKNLQPEIFNMDFNQKPHMKKESRYVDFLTLQFKCQFPLNLILNKKSMAKYQLLFRFIFWCKYIQRQLNDMWLNLQATKHLRVKAFQQAYLLNQRMINYVKNLNYYLAYDIIEHNWHVLMDNLKKVETFQQIMHFHDLFLNKCLHESLLMNTKLLPILSIQLGSTCQISNKLKNCLSGLFLQEIKMPINPKQSIILQIRHKQNEMKKIMKTNDELNIFSELIDNLSTQFDNGMKKLLRQVYSMVGKQQNHLIGFIDRLDQQKFYNRKFFNTMSQRNPREEM